MSASVLSKQLEKVQRHYEALREYKAYIEATSFDFSVERFRELDTPQKAVLDAYLKRFAALQDYLGAKVFKSLLDASGIAYTKMSEVLTLIESEGIISLDRWIEFRNIRNDLEHDYPDELAETLQDLAYCVRHFDYMEQVVADVMQFAERYGAHI
jgi:hypothetical protein